MRVRQLFALFIVLAILGASADAQSICSGTVTGPDRNPMPRADVSLLTPDRVTVLQTVRAAADGRFSLEVPAAGLWVVRCTGVGGRLTDIALYVPDSRPIRLSVSLPGHRYLAGELSLQVLGDFNLWSIPNAVALQRTPEGSYEAEIPTTKDSVTIRLRGYRDEDGVEGIVNASFLLNGQGIYDARIPAVQGKALVQVDTRRIDRSRAAAVITFDEASPRTKRIAGAIHAWWSGEDEYFAQQNDHALDRLPAGATLPDWNAFVAGLLRQADAEKDTLVRSFWDLGFVCTTMKTKSKAVENLARSLNRMRATSIAWSYSPNTLAYAVRNAKWSPSAIERYVRNAMDRHRDPVVRRRVLFNEFAIAFDAEKDARAAKYYKILTTKYADTPEGRQALKDYPDPALDAPKK